MNLKEENLLNCTKSRKHHPYPDDGVGCLQCEYAEKLTIGLIYYKIKDWLSHQWFYKSKNFGRFRIEFYSMPFRQVSFGWSFGLSPNNRILSLSEYHLLWWGLRFQYDLHPEWDNYDFEQGYV